MKAPIESSHHALHVSRSEDRITISTNWRVLGVTYGTATGMSVQMASELYEALHLILFNGVERYENETYKRVEEEKQRRDAEIRGTFASSPSRSKPSIGDI